jgi:hypothetical protein
MKFYTIDQVKPRFTITVRSQSNIDVKINLCTSPLVPYNISIRPKERYIFCGKFAGENIQYEMKVFTIVVNPTLYINKDEHPKVNLSSPQYHSIFIFNIFIDPAHRSHFAISDSLL